MTSAVLKLSPIEEIITEIKSGRMIILVDDVGRENEGDLVVASEAVTPEIITFMMQQARGLICVSLSKEVAERLQLAMQTTDNNSRFQTPFTVSVDYFDLAHEGVTANARARTIKALLDDQSDTSMFISPGHVFPLVAQSSGVISRQGQTEGSYDLAKLAGFKSSGIICEILNPDGSMARGEELNSFAKKHSLKICSIEQIIQHRVSSEILVEEVAQNKVETDYGIFEAHAFEDRLDGKEHLALVYGDLNANSNQSGVLVRIHSECLTGDVFGSRRCDCGKQLSYAMKSIVDYGAGVVLYLRQEGRGIGLANKLRAYALQDQGHDTVEANLKLGFKADQREFAVAANILKSLGIKQIRLMTNNPEKLETLSRLGLPIKERVPLWVENDPITSPYLKTKREKLGHLA